MNQVSKNLLKKNYNDWAIFSIINNAKLKEKTVYGWKIIVGKKVTVEVVFHIIRKFRNEIVIKAVGPQGRQNLGNLAAGAQNLNFYLPDDLVLFQSEVKQIEANGNIRVTFPKMIAQVDRRKHLRLFVENGIKVNVGFTKENHGAKKVKQQFKKPCFDISGGGLSFIVSRTEKAFFKEGDLIEKLKVELDNEQIMCHAKIINIFEVQPDQRNGLIYKGFKICLKLLDMPAESKKKLEEFVFRYVDLDEAI